MTEPRKSLWMRYVDFEKIRDAVGLVAEHDGKLRAADLERLARETGIFCRETGKPFSRTTMYHYRKVMEHLNLVKLERQRYCLESNHCTMLLRRKSGQRLSPEDRKCLANEIVRNSDCQYHFFGLFMPDKDRILAGVEQFRSEASHIIARTDESGVPVLVNPKTEAQYVLDTNDKLQAIFWGVRLWSLDLQVTDEIFTYPEGRIIFPILERNTLRPLQILKTILSEIEPSETWVTFSVPELTRRWAPSLKVSPTALHDAIREIQTRYPQFVDFIPTSASFIDIRTPFARRDQVLFKGYMKDSKGRFISHVRLHRDVWTEYTKGTRREANVSRK